MAASKLIVIIGATGNQGGSVAKTFLELDAWKVRAITRNPGSEAAQSLVARGAEVIKADLTDPSTLPPAFHGAHAIFVNTDFWATYHPAKAELDSKGEPPEPASHKAFDYETTNGKNAAVAAAAVPTLERFVYSALSPIAKGSKGKYTRSLHSEAKSWIVEYIENEQPALAKKTSFIYPGVYNVNRMLTPRLDPSSGKYIFALPVKKETKIPIIDAKESIGPLVKGLLLDEPAGVKLLGYDSYPTAGDIVDEWSKASGKDAVFFPISTQMMHEQYKLPWELLDAPDYLAEFGYTAGIDGIIEPQQLQNKVQTRSFESWLQERDWDEVLAA